MTRGILLCVCVAAALGVAALCGAATSDSLPPEELVQAVEGSSNAAASGDDAGSSSRLDIWASIRLDAMGITGFVLAGLFQTLAAGSGLGGGGVLVPLFLIFSPLDPIQAVALSNVSILGASITNLFINSTWKHPSANRPLVSLCEAMFPSPENN